MKKLEITPETIIFDLIKEYPELEDKLIQIASVFKKLKNPILKRTIARVTTLKQAATIGNIPLPVLINTLRKNVGQESGKYSTEQSKAEPKPDWIDKYEIKIRYNSSEDLENGIAPVTKVLKDLEGIEKNDIYLLTAPFLPLPLIDILKEKMFDIFFEKIAENEFNVYIKK